VVHLKSNFKNRQGLKAVIFLLITLGGCGDEQSSAATEKGRVLIELKYLGGAVAEEFKPKLEILEGGVAIVRRAGTGKEVRLSESEMKSLYDFAIEGGFLDLNSNALQERTSTLIRNQGGPITNVMDGSLPEIKVWNGEAYHTVSFYAPRQFIKHSGDNPELAIFVELLTSLEAILSSE
jgi:hypothetical protein